MLASFQPSSHLDSSAVARLHTYASAGLPERRITTPLGFRWGKIVLSEALIDFAVWIAWELSDSREGVFDECAGGAPG